MFVGRMGKHLPPHLNAGRESTSLRTTGAVLGSYLSTKTYLVFVFHRETWKMCGNSAPASGYALPPLADVAVNGEQRTYCLRIP